MHAQSKFISWIPHWSAGAGPTDAVGLATNNHSVIITAGRDIRISATSSAVNAKVNHDIQGWFAEGENTETALVESVISTVQVLDISRDVLVLVGRPRKIIRETSSRKGDSGLRLDAGRSSNSSNERT